MDESWTDTNLNRVSVIQFLDEPKVDDEEESGAERRVRSFLVACYLPVEAWAQSTVFYIGQEAIMVFPSHSSYGIAVGLY